MDMPLSTFDDMHVSSFVCRRYVIFIYANLGMQLFSLTKWGEGLDSNLSFATFPRAFTAFIKFAAGEDWYIRESHHIIIDQSISIYRVDGSYLFLYLYLLC
jgi:hypothetical protein